MGCSSRVEDRNSQKSIRYRSGQEGVDDGGESRSEGRSSRVMTGTASSLEKPSGAGEWAMRKSGTPP